MYTYTHTHTHTHTHSHTHTNTHIHLALKLMRIQFEVGKCRFFKRYHSTVPRTHQPLHHIGNQQPSAKLKETVFIQPSCLEFVCHLGKFSDLGTGEVFRELLRIEKPE